MIHDNYDDDDNAMFIVCTSSNYYGYYQLSFILHFADFGKLVMRKKFYLTVRRDRKHL